jgi:hypothetical protein
MNISKKDWLSFVKAMSRINEKAANAIVQYAQKVGFDNRDMLVGYAYDVVSTYGNASASIAATMYDEIANFEGEFLQPAVLADTPDYGEVAKTVYGTLKTSENPKELGGAVSRLVKRTGQDTMLKNAIRDRAEFAWIPVGDTCPFCIMLASRGWQPISAKVLKNGHAEHIHANCDCAYMIRHSKDLDVSGYNPDKYRKMYNSADGKMSEDKINSMRRMRYADRKDIINAQKRAAYAARQEKDLPLTQKLSDELIHKSVGAKSRNYAIMDLTTGDMFQLVEGEYIHNKEVFAGKGVKVPYLKAERYAEKYGGKPEDWMHVKGIGLVRTKDGDRKAEIHWSQCDGIGAVEHFIKEYLD